MAEFPPNLDDGELWLPSDIFRNDVPPKYNPYHISSMENLSSHFSAFSLLQNHPPKHAFNSQRLKPAVREPFPTGFGGLDGGGGAEFDRMIYGSNLTRFEPVYEFLIQPPETSQALKPGNAYRVDNNRVLGRQQDPIQNRVYPFKPSGFGFCGGGGGGGLKESGGTGVFHPRIVNHTTEVKRKQCELAWLL